MTDRELVVSVYPSAAHEYLKGMWGYMTHWIIRRDKKHANLKLFIGNGASEEEAWQDAANVLKTDMIKGLSE